MALRLLIVVLSCITVLVMPQRLYAGCILRSLSVSAETKAAMARYGLEAFGNGDAKNALYALLYTPKAKGGKGTAIL